MPRISNNSALDINWRGEGIVIPGNGEINQYQFTQSNPPTNITVDDTKMVFDPIIYGEAVSVTKMVNIPATNGAYTLSFFCSTGSASIQFNNISANTLKMGVGQKEEFTFQNRLVKTVIFTITSGTVQFNVKKA